MRRIAAAVGELNWIPNAAARQLRKGDSPMVAFVAYDIAGPLFARIARGAHDKARNAGLSLVLADTDRHPAEREHSLSLFTRQRIKGVLLSPIESGPELSTALDSLWLSYVLIAAKLDFLEAWSVAVDDISGGRMAVEHLISIGRTGIAVVGGPGDVRQIRESWEDAQSAAHSSGITIEFIATETRDVQSGREAGERHADADRASDRSGRSIAAADSDRLSMIVPDQACLS